MKNDVDDKKKRFDSTVKKIRDAVFGQESFQGNISIPIKNGEIGKVKIENWWDPGAQKPKPRVITEDEAKAKPITEEK